ncbi:hypothetical protein [Paraburkholderia adhaesiva]|nr:hypothetical protein [Paraburkholderia adhaesiva]
MQPAALNPAAQASFNVWSATVSGAGASLIGIGLARWVSCLT